MARYCAIHGPREVPDGPPNQVFMCDYEIAGGRNCNTVLTADPPRRGPAASAPPVVPPYETLRSNARADKAYHQMAFLAAYAMCGNITKAAKMIGIERQTHYDWMESDPQYDKLFAEAHKRAVQTMVDRAHEIAFGETPDTRLIIKMLESIPRGMMPPGWDFNPARRNELTGPGGGPIETSEVTARDALASKIASLAPTSDPPSGS